MAIGLAVASTAFSIAATVSAARQQQQNAYAQESMLEYNTRQERVEAKNAEEETKESDIRLRQEQERQRAARRAMYGKSGAAMYAGSPLALLGETASNQQIESNDLRRQGATEYNRRMSAAAAYSYQAQIARNSYSSSANKLAIAGGVLSGIGSISSAAGQDVRTGVATVKAWNLITG